MTKQEIEALKAELAATQAKLQAVTSSATKRLRLGVSDKGCVSVYGIRRFPVSFYAGEWAKLLAFVGAPEGNAVEAFISANLDKLSMGKVEEA